MPIGLIALALALGGFGIGLTEFVIMGCPRLPPTSRSARPRQAG